MKRSTWTLIGILLILGIITALVLRQPGEVSTSGSTGKMLVSFDSAAVDRIEIHSPGGQVTLERRPGGWMLTDPVQYPADAKAVAMAVGSAQRMEVSTPVSSNPANQHLFQVDSTGTLVKMSVRGNDVASFMIGKPSTSYTETYVRKEGSNDVFAAQGLLTYLFGGQTREWRDKTIFKAELDEIREVRMHYGDTTFTLTNADSAWRVDSDSASQPVVHAFLSSLANFQTDGFIDSATPNLPKPACIIEVGGSQLSFFLNKPAGKYIVRSSQSPQQFEIQDWRAKQLLKRKKDFLAGAA